MTTQSQTKLPPIRKAVRIPLEREAAFRRFTEQIAEWWPIATHSTFKAEAETVVFERKVDGKVFERAGNGDTSVWGTVLVWDPPKRVRFTWHPGREASSMQEVEVRFIADGDGTRVELEHTGWEVFGDEAQTMRTRYQTGWDGVLERYCAL